MSDLVERLRAAASHPYNQHGPHEFLTEAAARIAQLEAELDLARRGAASTWRPTHRHVKRGSTYQMIGTAELQAAGVIAEGEPVVVYRAEDGKLWARPMEEFNDGRFMPLPPPPSGEPSDE